MKHHNAFDGAQRPPARLLLVSILLMFAVGCSSADPLESLNESVEIRGVDDVAADLALDGESDADANSEVDSEDKLESPSSTLPIDEGFGPLAEALAGGVVLQTYDMRVDDFGVQALQVIEGLGPSKLLGVASNGRGDLEGVLDLAEAVDDHGGVLVLVSVDAEDCFASRIKFCCREGVSLNWLWGDTAPAGTADRTLGMQLNAPMRSRSPDRSVHISQRQRRVDRSAKGHPQDGVSHTLGQTRHQHRNTTILT